MPEQSSVISPIKYFLYARKSSESDDQQSHSIEDQTAQLTKLATERGMKVVETFQEAHSAKAPGERPIFDDMIKRIEAGEANGILCWHLNRLARNPVDGGRIQWMLMQGVIQSIVTPDAEHKPSENAVLLSLETGVATEYVVELMKNVRRGLQRKLERGIRPTRAPIGYLNEHYERTIVPDPERFHLVRRIWGSMLSGKYRPNQILQMTREWGLKTKPTPHQPSRPLSKSGLYKILGNKFYCGIMVYGKRELPGKHEKMVTLEQFEKVQQLISGRTKPEHHHHDRAFTGLITCGECGRAITAETKIKNGKESSITRTYTYYHCTHSNKDTYCSQRHCLREEDLAAEIVTELAKFEIVAPLSEWAMGRATDDAKLAIQFAVHAKNWFQTNNVSLQRAIFSAFSEHASLKEGVLQIKTAPWLTQLRDKCEPLHRQFDNLCNRPKNSSTAREMSLLRFRMCGIVDDVRTFFEQNDADAAQLKARLQRIFELAREQKLLAA